MKKNLFSLAIATLLMIITILRVLTTSTIIGAEHYWGFALIVSSSVLYFFNQKSYLVFWGITLAIGIFSIVEFFYLNVRFGFRFGNTGEAQISFNFISIILLFIFLLENRDILFPKPSERLKTEKEPDKNYIARLKDLYQEKSPEELKRIADPNSTYAKEGKIAAAEILMEKYNT